MKKKVVRLTEGELKQVIENTINEHYLIKEDFGTFFSIFTGIAALRILYNFIKRKYIFKRLSKNDISALDYVILQGKGDKELIGEIVDDNKEAKITYKYGSLGSKIIFSLDKERQILDFRWDFSQFVFPFIKMTTIDPFKIKLNNDEYQKVLNIFDKLKSEKFGYTLPRIMI